MDMLDPSCQKAAFDFWDALGLTGVLALNYTYAKLQYHRDYAKAMSYSVINLIASLFMVASLLNKFNVASFVGNVVWTFMSLYGIYRCAKYKQRDYLEAQQNKEKLEKDTVA